MFPNEKYPIDVKFFKAVPLGASEIASISVACSKWLRKQPGVVTENANEILDDVDPIIVGVSKTTARIYLNGGTSNYDYKLKVTAVFDSGSIKHEEVFIRIK